MREKNYVFASEQLVVAVARDLHDIQLHQDVLAALARSLSLEGLLAAAEYFTSEAVTRSPMLGARREG